MLTLVFELFFRDWIKLLHTLMWLPEDGGSGQHTLIQITLNLFPPSGSGIKKKQTPGWTQFYCWMMEMVPLPKDSLYGCFLFWYVQNCPLQIFHQYSRVPRWHSGKESTCWCKRRGSNPWVRKIPWRRTWQPTPVFLPGKFPWTEEPVGYSPWAAKIQMQLSNWAHTHTYIKVLLQMLKKPEAFGNLNRPSSVGCNPLLPLPVQPIYDPRWFCKSCWVVGYS